MYPIHGSQVIAATCDVRENKAFGGIDYPWRQPWFSVGLRAVRVKGSSTVLSEPDAAHIWPSHPRVFLKCLTKVTACRSCPELDEGWNEASKEDTGHVACTMMLYLPGDMLALCPAFRQLGTTRVAGRLRNGTLPGLVVRKFVVKDAVPMRDAVLSNKNIEAICQRFNIIL